MHFFTQVGRPSGKLSGLVFVVVLHVAMVLALMHGLKRQTNTFVPPEPIEWVKVIDQPLPKPLPPPRENVLPPVNRVQAPLLPDLPPVVLEAPVVAPPDKSMLPAEGLANTAKGLDTSRDPPAASVGVACPNAQEIRATMRYPAQARREGLQGDVVARFLVTAQGQITNLNIVSSSNRAFNNAVMAAVRQFSCTGQGRDLMVEVPFSFRLE